MFHKEGSSVTTKGGKKSKDVPLRKSDRRRLLQTVQSVLLQSNNDDSDNKATTAGMLEAAFLQGAVSSRILHMTTGTKVTCYMRSPNPAGTGNNNNNNDNDDDDATTNKAAIMWPYSVSPQLLWMQVQQGAGDEPWQVPSLALLAALQQSNDTSTTTSLVLPVVTVPPAVSKYICRGAHLMRAGMRSLPTQQQQQQQTGRIVAICIQGNPQPAAVGYLVDSIKSADMIGVGTSGVGVEIVTCYGDDWWKQQLSVGSVQHDGLFDAGQYGNLGFYKGIAVLPLEGGYQESESDDEAEANEGNDATATAEPIDGSTIPTDPDASNEAGLSKLSLENAAKDEEEEEEETMSPEDILHAAVCKALVSIRPKQQLPMNMATFYAQHVIPNRPPGTTIELKKTKYKKLGYYVQEQVNDDLLLVGPDAAKKDPMAMLLGYNRRHEDLRWYLQDQRDNPQESVTATAVPKKLVLLPLYCVPHHFVEPMRLDRDAVKAENATSPERQGTGLLTQKEIRYLLEDYIAKENLVDPVRPDRIILNGPLTDALFKTKKKGGPKAPEVLSRKDAITAWQGKMEAAFCLVETPGNRMLQLGRGKPPSVEIEVVMRQSKKFVTRVRGLEDFGLDPVVVSKDVAHRFACSASVEDQTDGRAALKRAHVELTFQGNLADELEALLLSDESLTTHGGAKGSLYHLPRNSIKVTLRKGVPAGKRRKAANKK